MIDYLALSFTLIVVITVKMISNYFIVNHLLKKEICPDPMNKEPSDHISRCAGLIDAMINLALLLFVVFIQLNWPILPHLKSQELGGFVIAGFFIALILSNMDLAYQLRAFKHQRAK